MSDCDDAAVLLAWITLSRVAEGSVTKQGDHYLDGGAPTALSGAPIMTLLADGSLALADADPAGWCQVILTEVGQTRYHRLRQDKRQQERTALTP